ncbi:hypothetical protein GCM10007362_07580 [Saccharibacillus endophyticus]|uniref:Uncharacterized protein n=1 Tax=Saccharibacillus endophyticus TaxID=2060666 RepID=A0ABQ1ZN12_9BACL|nr:hypothetical protein GCM10007362_07580 [Saccharibacillus endophyticus]
MKYAFERGKLKAFCVRQRIERISPAALRPLINEQDLQAKHAYTAICAIISSVKSNVI